MRNSTPLALVVLLVGAAASAQGVTAPPSLETEPGPALAGGAVQDVAVWVNPADGGASLIFAAYDNANAGLVTFGPDGQQLEQEQDGDTLSVAVQDGFPLAGSTRTLVLTANATVNGLRAYVLDPQGAERLTPLGTGTFRPGAAASALAPYRSPATGRFYLFAAGAGGDLQQLELTGADGGVTATPVRTFDVGAGVSGMVVDEETNSLFVVETGTALWRYAAEADGGTGRQAVTGFPGGSLSLDVNRLALYRAANGEGYLLAANTGSDAFAVFERRSLAFVGSFRVGSDGGIDAVERPVGLAVTPRPVGPAFPDGLFIAHDSTNGAIENLKLVSWPAVANAFSPPLRIDTQFDPDGGTDGGADGGRDGGGTSIPPPTGGGFPPVEEDSGCSCASASVPATALFGLLALMLARRRRER